MKNRIIYALAIVAGLASCSTYEESVEAPAVTFKEGDAVTFTASIEGTRVEGSEFEKNDAISVAAISSGTTLSDNSEYKFESDDTADTFISSDENPITALSDDQKISYYATYPAQSSSLTEPFTFTVSSDQSTSTESSDLLVAVVEDQVANTAADLPFEHVLSSIRFTIEAESESFSAIGDGDAEVYITAVAAVECDVVAGTYLASGNTTTIKAMPVGVHASSSATYSYVYEAVIPAQSIADNFITVKLSGQSDHEWGAAEVDVVRIFEPGMQYSYTYDYDLGAVPALTPATDVQVEVGYKVATVTWVDSGDSRVTGYEVIVDGDVINSVDEGVQDYTVVLEGSATYSFVINAIGSDDATGADVPLSTKTESVSDYVYGDDDIVAYPVSSASYDGDDATFTWGENPLEGIATVAVEYDVNTSGSATSVDSFDGTTTIESIDVDDAIAIKTTYTFSKVGTAGQPAAKTVTYTAKSTSADISESFDDIKSQWSAVYDTESLDTDGTPTLAGDAVCGVAGWVVSNMWDGAYYTTTGFHTNGGVHGQAVTIDLGAEYVLSEMFISPRNYSGHLYAAHMLKEFDLYGAAEITQDMINAEASGTPSWTGWTRLIKDGYNGPDGTDATWTSAQVAISTYLTTLASEGGHWFDVTENTTTSVRYVRICLTENWNDTEGSGSFTICELDFKSSDDPVTVYSIEVTE